MLSNMGPDESNKAQDGRPLRHAVSEQSIELLSLSEDDKKALISPIIKKPWKPLTQKAYFLIPTILASGALIAVLQIFLSRSNRESGILFASKIIDLPLNQTFSYLYLPTIVSLVLSFVWTWIDLDIKRLEPFVQLSRKDGSLGANSLLLHYPFDFIGLVPFIAIRRRHWSVFLASIAVVLVFWGLTPLQSSIFATITIEKSLAVPALSLTSQLSLHEQKTTLTGLYAQSVYNIVWLNESLPPFMNRQGMLAPFTLANNDIEIGLNETWTAPTRFYSVDLECEEPTYGGNHVYSSWGCDYYGRYILMDPSLKKGQYSTMYMGYWYEESMDSYLMGDCPKEANQTFLISFLAGGTGSPNKISHSTNVNATLWCRPSYYQQEVSATIVPPSMRIVDVQSIGPKTAFPNNLINITDFEWSMSQGYEANNNRGSYLTSSWPNPKERVHTNFPELYWEYYLPNMASLALGAYPRPIADYLDVETLKNSYQAAYRLLLARKLADVFSNKTDNAKTVFATRHYQTQALIMVPTFVYIVEGLVAVTAAIATLIFVVPSWRKTCLVSEPASIASLMTLTSKDPRIITEMSEQDCVKSEELKRLYEQTKFILQSDHGREPMLCYIGPDARLPMDNAKDKPTKTFLPFELSWAFGSGFLSLQCSVVAALAYVYIQADLHNGLPLPSRALFVNQLFVRYLPMIVGAFFEPIFTWLTRTLCMLQPYEMLRKGNAEPSRSIFTGYNALPPQAVAFGVFKDGRITLASLCCLMTLLANVISVAFSNLFHERITVLATTQNFTMGYQPLINASGIPNSTYDHFYIAMSNFTAGTPLPAWTDDSYFYLPFMIADRPDVSSTRYRARTTAFKASLQCFPIQQERKGMNLTWTVPDNSPSCNVSSLPTFPSFNSSVPEAVEFTMFRSYYADWGYSATCDLTVLAGWGRSSTNSVEDPVDASWIGCQPQILTELREVTVNRLGIVESSASIGDVLDYRRQLPEIESKPILEAFHTLLSDSNSPQYPYANIVAQPTHNDTYPSDFLNYFMVQILNSSAILDPDLPPPSYNMTAPLVQALYAKIFAIVLGTHVQTIFQPSDETVQAPGSTMTLETRIFVSVPMFILSVAILGIYIVFTATLYIARPWKILPRMPTTIASQIPFFAASHALQDFSDRSDTLEIVQTLGHQGLKQRYGFGRFIGTDGKAHIGIEREPLVQILTKKDLHLMHRDASLT